MRVPLRVVQVPGDQHLPLPVSALSATRFPFAVSLLVLSWSKHRRATRAQTMYRRLGEACLARAGVRQIACPAWCIAEARGLGEASLAQPLCRSPRLPFILRQPQDERAW